MGIFSVPNLALLPRRIPFMVVREAAAAFAISVIRHNAVEVIAGFSCWLFNSFFDWQIFAPKLISQKVGYFGRQAAYYAKHGNYLVYQLFNKFPKALIALDKLVFSISKSVIFFVKSLISFCCSAVRGKSLVLRSKSLFFVFKLAMLAFNAGISRFLLPKTLQSPV